MPLWSKVWARTQAFPAVADLCIAMRRLMSFASLVSCFNFVVDRCAIEKYWFFFFSQVGSWTPDSILKILPEFKVSIIESKKL